MGSVPMLKYLLTSYDKILAALIDHVVLAGVAMFFAIILASGLVFVARNHPLLRQSLVYAFSLAYGIPSLALFALLIPLTGLGKDTAIVALVIYAQYILVRNFFLGLDEVDDSLVEVARAMGMTENQVLYKVQLPLASNSIFSGLKLAMTSVIGIATVATTINGGGLGTLLFEGLRTSSMIKMLWGTLLTMMLCILVNGFINGIQRLMSKYING